MSIAPGTLSEFSSPRRSARPSADAEAPLQRGVRLWPALVLTVAASLGAPPAAAFDLDDGRLEIRAFLAARGVLLDSVETSGKPDLDGLGEAEGGAEARWRPWESVEAGIGYTALVEFDPSLRSRDHEFRARLSARPWRALRLSADSVLSFYDGPDLETDYHRAGASCSFDIRPPDFPLAPGGDYRFARIVYGGIGGNPAETRHEVRFHVLSMLPEDSPVQGRIGCRAGLTISPDRARAYRGHCFEAVLLFPLHRSFFIDAMAFYEVRTYRETGAAEVWSASLRMELWLLEFLAVEAGIDMVRYTGAVPGDYRALIRGFAGLRLEI
jgi:hypothetical protein